jgi:hypothetical protein
LRGETPSAIHVLGLKLRLAGLKTRLMFLKTPLADLNPALPHKNKIFFQKYLQIKKM